MLQTGAVDKLSSNMKDWQISSRFAAFFTPPGMLERIVEHARQVPESGIGEFVALFIVLAFHRVMDADYVTDTMQYSFRVPAISNLRRSPFFLPTSCWPKGDCGVITRISFLSRATSVPPARGPMK